MNMNEPRQFLAAGLRGVMRDHVPMSKLTSWRVGGLVDRVYQPADLDDLVVFMRSLSIDEPLYEVGLGSNLLVRDGGLRGTVLLLHGALSELRLQSDGVIYAEAGVPGAKLARFAALHNLRGAEFFAGIPGTLGGMLAMNAGCYGSETWSHVREVQVINRQGEVTVRSPSEYQIRYRHAELCIPRDERFMSAWLGFPAGDGAVARREIKELLNKRIASQPLQQPNCGSVFRNPSGDHAARLIQQCGLKGVSLGGAQISEKHANFIVNTGNATAADIEKLIEHVCATVLRQTGIELHPEVKIIGEYKQHE